jgi:hypothetical protein
MHAISVLNSLAVNGFAEAATSATSRGRARCLAMSLMMLLAACGGSGGGETGVEGASPNDVDRATDQSSNGSGSAGSVIGKSILYLATSNTQSEYEPFTGITIRQNSQVILRIVPSTNAVTIVARNESFDFAASTIYPYTVDDRLFTRRETPATAATASHGLMEWDPVSGEPLIMSPGYRLMNAPYQSGIGCSAIVAQRYYYRAASGTDVFGTTWGGDLRQAILDTSLPVSTQLIPRQDTDNCKGSLHSAGGKLYDAQFGLGSVWFFQRNLDTGRTVSTVTLPVAQPASYPAASYRFAFDDGVAYFARQSAGGVTQVWRYVLGGPPPPLSTAVLIHESDVDGFVLTDMDADDGRIALGGNRKVILLDSATGSADVYEMPFSFYGMQVLHIRP